MCEAEVNACSSSPCHQRATCLSRQGSFQCICPSGYVGATCDADADECSSSPCLNSGTCLNSPGSFHCLCPRGYSGPKCQVTLDLCSDFVCVAQFGLNFRTQLSPGSLLSSQPSLLLWRDLRGSA
ncbi:Crumbs-like 2, partial [Ophiophagus hannah]